MRRFKLVSNSIIYLGSSILNKSIPFLLLPIMTYYLSPEEYGSLSIFLMLIMFFSAFVGMNITINVEKNFFRVSKESMALYIGNMLFILLCSFLVCLAFTFLISFFYESLFSIPIYWIYIIPIISLFMMVNNINTTILRNEGKAILYGIFEISITIVNMSITVFLVSVIAFGWFSQAIGILISYSLFFVLGLIYMNKRNYINMTIDKAKIKSILNISLPLIPHILGASIIALSDRLFIEKMVNLEEVGIYSVGYMFGMIIMLFSDAFIKTWSPWFYKSLENPSSQNKNRIVKYTYLYIVGIIFLAILVSLAGIYIMPFFVDKKFQSASQYIFWVSIGYAVFGVYQIFFPYLVHLNKTSFLAFSTITAAVCNLIFNYFFIRYFGTIGAAYATVAAFIISAGLVFIYQKKHYDMPWTSFKL